MQSMYRPPFPPQGMRPGESHSPGIVPPTMPPLQRPPGGFRSPMETKPPNAPPPSGPPTMIQAPPPGPPSGPPGSHGIAPPTQKLASMNLGPPQPNAVQHNLSNGLSQADSTFHHNSSIQNNQAKPASTNLNAVSPNQTSLASPFSMSASNDVTSTASVNDSFSLSPQPLNSMQGQRHPGPTLSAPSLSPGVSQANSGAINASVSPNGPGMSAPISNTGFPVNHQASLRPGMPFQSGMGAPNMSPQPPAGSPLPRPPNVQYPPSPYSPAPGLPPPPGSSNVASPNPNVSSHSPNVPFSMPYTPSSSFARSPNAPPGPPTSSFMPPPGNTMPPLSQSSQMGMGQPPMPSPVGMGQPPMSSPMGMSQQPPMSSPMGMGQQPPMPPRAGMEQQQMPPRVGMGHQPMPPMGMNQPPGSMGQQPMGMNQPPVSMGQQPMPPMGMNQPPGSMGQQPMTPMGMNQPPGSMGQQPMPPMGMNQPPGSMGQQPMPPMGMNQPPGNMGQQPPGGGMQNRYPGSSPGGSVYSQTPQGRRLNPDDMPGPLQVIEEDRQTKSGEFITNSKGCLPPLVTTDFVVKDGGNASPRFIRSSMYNIPATQDMMKQTSVPFSLVISPFADLHPNEAPLYQGTSLNNGPVRCLRCRGYMSPLMVFMDGGRRYQCLLCKQVNDVPPDYFCHMDSHGGRADKFQRPELCLGSYEFVATAEYCKDKLLPKEPAFIFVLEMSQMMIQRGVIDVLCRNMNTILQNLPKDEVAGEEVTKSVIKVGFITYDSSVHFYKLSGLAPEMCVVCDKENMFVPFPEGVLCDVEEVSDNIDKLMESIPQNFNGTKENSGQLYNAIEAGMAALHASGRTGKLFVFHSSLPHFEGLGKLKNREDRKLLGSDKEKTILTPQNNNYNNLAQNLVSVGCGVDLYMFNESYIDLATIGQVCRLTGGQCYKYSTFQVSKDSERLLEDLKINVSRNIGFDAVMRVRTSTGVRPVDFYGHFFMSNTQDIELAVIDSNKSVTIEIKHDDKLTEEDGVYIQVALLYTSSGGQRKLKIFNLSFDICRQMAEMYKNCDLDTIMNFFAKQSVFKLMESTPKQVKDNLISRTSQILACYRKNCASPSSIGQLILPELMKLLPLYMNCLMKCDAVSGGQDLTCDERSWHMYQLNAMSVEASVPYFYPRLLPISNLDLQTEDMPVPVRTSHDRLAADGAYLLENGLFMFLWVGSGCPPEWMKNVFGVSAPHQLDPTLSELPELDNPTSVRVRSVIKRVRKERKTHVRLFVVPQQGKHEIIMRNYLVEDRGVSGTPSYVDFLCHVHKEIRDLLT